MYDDVTESWRYVTDVAEGNYGANTVAVGKYLWTTNRVYYDRCKMLISLFVCFVLFFYCFLLSGSEWKVEDKFLSRS